MNKHIADAFDRVWTFRSDNGSALRYAGYGDLQIYIYIYIYAAHYNRTHP